MNTKPNTTRREVQLDENDKRLLAELATIYGSEAQAIRVAIRQLAGGKK